MSPYYWSGKCLLAHFSKLLYFKIIFLFFSLIFDPFFRFWSRLCSLLLIKEDSILEEGWYSIFLNFFLTSKNSPYLICILLMGGFLNLSLFLLVRADWDLDGWLSDSIDPFLDPLVYSLTLRLNSWTFGGFFDLPNLDFKQGVFVLVMLLSTSLKLFYFLEKKMPFYLNDLPWSKFWYPLYSLFYDIDLFWSDICTYSSSSSSLLKDMFFVDFPLNLDL